MTTSTLLSTSSAHAASEPDARSLVRSDLALAGATVTTGLLAGLLYGYAVSVMPGLHGTRDESFIDAMQHINVAIQNPLFMATLLGAPLLTAWALLRERRSASGTGRLIAAALALELVFFAITGAVNIPLNNTLAHAGEAHRLAADGAAAHVRAHFETTWDVFNAIRAAAMVGAFACLTRAASVRRSLR